MLLLDCSIAIVRVCGAGYVGGGRCEELGCTTSWVMELRCAMIAHLCMCCYNRRLDICYMGCYIEWGEMFSPGRLHLVPPAPHTQ